MKILNAYSGLGGNRRLWGDKHKITAVEINPKIAAAYQDIYPQDDVVVGDAHEYILNNYQDYDLIWTSPPCQTHSSFRKNIGVKFRGVKAVYPDMKLWQEIIFLSGYFKGLFVVENVKPFYEPLITPSIFLQRHMFWSNGNLYNSTFKPVKLRSIQLPGLQEHHNINLENYNLTGLNKRQLLRNMVDGDLGLHILNCLTSKIKNKQVDMFGKQQELL